MQQGGAMVVAAGSNFNMLLCFAIGSCELLLFALT